MAQPNNSDGNNSSQRIGTSYKELKEAYMQDIKNGCRWFPDEYSGQGEPGRYDDDPDCNYYNCS